MKFYKNDKNNVYAFEEDGSQDAFIKPELTQISEAEADQLRAPTAEQIKSAADAATLAELAAIDAASIRAIREYIASKADAPQILKDRELAAQAARAKLK